MPLKFFMNIKIIKTGIDPKPFLDQITENDWNWVSRQKGLGGDKNPYGFLPLIAKTQSCVPEKLALFLVVIIAVPAEKLVPL